MAGKKKSTSKPKKAKKETTKVNIELPPIEYSDGYEFLFADGVQSYVESNNQGRLIFFRKDPYFEDLLSFQGPGPRRIKIEIVSEVALPYNTMVELRDALNRIMPAEEEDEG